MVLYKAFYLFCLMSFYVLKCQFCEKRFFFFGLLFHFCLHRIWNKCLAQRESITWMYPHLTPHVPLPECLLFDTDQCSTYSTYKNFMSTISIFKNNETMSKMLNFIFLKHMNKNCFRTFPTEMTTTSKIPNRLPKTFSSYNVILWEVPDKDLRG